MVCQKLGHQPTRAIDVPSLGAPRDREQVMRLLAVRPGAWEYMLWAGLIHQGVKAIESKWRDHQLRLRRPDGERVSTQDVFDLLGTASDRILITMDNLMSVLSPEPQETAFGAPGEPGDPEAIEHIAHRFVTSYEAILDWATDVRSMLVTEELRQLRDIIARMADLPISQIRAFVERIVTETEAAALHVASGSEDQLHITLELKLEMDGAVMKEHTRELRRLRKLMRRGHLT